MQMTLGDDDSDCTINWIKLITDQQIVSWQFNLQKEEEVK